MLAGGRGTRLAEETGMRPKPMVEIGGMPILWHIMKTYSAFGLTEFIICAGYKGYMIKEYFANYVLHSSNVTVDLGKNHVEYAEARAEPWRVTLVDTGDASMTGGRLRRVAQYLPDSDPSGSRPTNERMQDLLWPILIRACIRAKCPLWVTRRHQFS